MITKGEKQCRKGLKQFGQISTRLQFNKHSMQRDEDKTPHLKGIYSINITASLDLEEVY